MAIVKELKNLGKKMTGGDISGNIISAALKAIEQGYSGGGPAETETVVLETTLGEGKALSTDFIQYTVRLDSLPDVPKAGVYLSVNGTRYPLSSVDSEDYVYTAAYNVELPEGTQIGTPWFMVGLEEKKGTGVDVLPGLLGGADTVAYILTVATGEPIDNAKVKLISKAAAPSGANDFIVNATLTPGEYSFALSDADAGFSDILAAVKAGKTVKLRAGSLDSPFPVALEMPLCAIAGDGGTDSCICFYGASSDGDSGEALLATAVALPGDGELEFVTKLISMESLKSYEFNFTMSIDQQGQISLAAGAGVTFESVKAAMEKTPDVFAIINSDANGGQISKAMFDTLDADFVGVNALCHFNGTFILLFATLDNTNTVTVYQKTLS